MLLGSKIVFVVISTMFMSNTIVNAVDYPLCSCQSKIHRTILFDKFMKNTRSKKCYDSILLIGSYFLSQLKITY